MYKIFATVLFFLGTCCAHAQVKLGVNPGSLNNNAILELESPSKGVLLPRLALTTTSSPSPLTAHVEGMVVFNTVIAGTGVTAVAPGFYYNNGSEWIRIGSVKKFETTYLMDAVPPASGSAGIGSYTSSTGVVSTVLPANASGSLFFDPLDEMYTWNGSSFVKYAAFSNTAWSIAGTSADAGANKHASIYRTGNVTIGNSAVNSSKLTAYNYNNNVTAGQTTVGITIQNQLAVNTSFAGNPAGMQVHQQVATNSGTVMQQSTGLLIYALKQSLLAGGANNSGTLNSLEGIRIVMGQQSSAATSNNGIINTSYGIKVDNSYLGSNATIYNATYDFFSSANSGSGAASINNSYGVYIQGAGKTNYFEGKVLVGKTTSSSVFAIAGLLQFSNNGAALGAGLTIGDFYRDNSGNVKVVF